jgi:hypothetical protein
MLTNTDTSMITQYKTNHYATGTTITGRRVRLYDIVTTADYPLIGAIEDEPNRWRMVRWTIQGRYYLGRENISDLADPGQLIQTLNQLHAQKIPLVCFDFHSIPYFIHCTDAPGTYSIHASAAARTGIMEMYTTKGQYSEKKQSADDLAINAELLKIINSLGN